MKTKICSKCKQEKLIGEFHRDKYRPDGYSNQCKVCKKANTAQWRRANKEHVLEYSRNHYHADPKHANEMSRQCNIKRKFGVMPEQYDRMLVDQNGCCAICGKHQSKLNRALAVDHDHITKEIRGLLCGSCNMSLGGFNHSPELLEKAAIYVR